MQAFDDLSRRADALLDANPAEAAPLYRKALEIRPAWAEGWFNLGGALYQMDRYAEAVDALRKAVALAPKHGPAWGLLGLCEAELDDADQALADIRRGEELGLGPNLEFETAVRVKAARLLVLASSFDEALLQLQPLSARGVDSKPVLDTMGLCSLVIPKKMSELTPKERQAVALTGKAAWAAVMLRPAEAAAAYRELLERFPDQWGVRYAHGLYLMESDLDAALAEFQKEVSDHPNNWPALIANSSLLIRQGTPEQAVELLRRALKIVPPKYRWLCHAELGRASMTADNLDAAIPELQTAVRMMPANAQVHYTLSQAYRRSGRKAESDKEMAEFHTRKAVEDPLGVASLRQVYGAGSTSQAQ
jgi:tetratricopeptide (TPR) repeat protein